MARLDASSLSTCLCSISNIVLSLLLASVLYYPCQTEATFTQCGGWVNETKGYMLTPNFPHEFPVPISCKWVLYAPPGKKIILYFTQYYLRESFEVSEYTHYTDDQLYVGKTLLGEIDVFDMPVLTAYKPYLVINFKAHEMGNIHLRVDDFLLDVYGFNITYEIVDEQQVVRTDACTVYKCSFLGNCLASSDFRSYRCSCFSGFYGDECEYGPYCDPDLGFNMCRNGGKCRYFYGSLVNTCECPPGYVGRQCENEQEGYVVDSVCEVSGCNQKCVQESNGTSYRCECIEGYRLSGDNKTCVEKGRMLFKAKITLPLDVPMEASLPLDADDEGILSPSSCTDQRLKDELFSETRRFGNDDEVSKRIGPSLQDFLNLTLLGIQKTSESIQIEFYFIGEKSERELVWSLLLEFIHDTKLCGRPLDADQIDFDPQPVLHSLSLQNNEKSPAIEGHLLTLVCKVRGSAQLQFEWFKDDAPVDVRRSERNMWQTRIPPNDGETHISILNIEKAHQRDEGDYTCRVSDWNETDTKSINIRVVPMPHLEISPLSRTVEPDSSVTISCLSRDDEQADFNYRWLRDGVGILQRAPLNQEMVEEIFPTGSRVELRKVVAPATYTCEVTSAAGTVRDHSKIAVFLDPKSLCQADQYLGVDWPATAGNETAVMGCPLAAVGRTSRRCSCRVLHQCQWQQPNFASCHSLTLDRYRQEMEKLQLGYRVVEVRELLDKLMVFSAEEPSHNPRLPGDLHLLGDLLVSLQRHVQHYGNSSDTPTSMKRRLQDILDLASTTLLRMDEVSGEERNDLPLGHYVIQLMKSVARDPSFTKVDGFQNAHLETKAIDLMTSRIRFTKELKEDYILHSHHGINVSLDTTSRVGRTSNRGTGVSTVTAVIYEGLSNLLSDVPPPVPGHTINSRVVFVGFADDDDVQVPFSIHFKHHRRTRAPARGINDTHCVYWKFDESSHFHWSMDSCELGTSHENYTVCICSWPGHYTIFSPNTALLEESSHTEVHLVSLIGCIISLSLFAATLITHAFFWIQMKDETRVVSVNFSCIMIAVNATMIAGFSITDMKVACHIVRLLLYGLYLAAFTFMLLEALKLYANSLGKTLGDRPMLKTLLAGWGVPAIAVLIVVITASTVGYSSGGHHICWITYQEWEFFAFISPVVVLIVVYTVLVSGAIKHSICTQPKNVKDGRRKYLFYICRSILSAVYLLAAVIFSIILASSEHDIVYEYLFATSMIALAILGLFMSCQGALNILIRCLFHPAICKQETETSMCGPCGDICLKVLNSICKSRDEAQSDDDAKAFKVFVRPQTLANEDSSNEHEASLQRDRLKYTKERKEQLQALLGSSVIDSNDSQQLSRTSTASSRFDDSEGLVMGPLEGFRPKYQNFCSTLPFKPDRCKAFIQPVPSDSRLEMAKRRLHLDNRRTVSHERFVADKVPCLIATDPPDDEPSTSTAVKFSINPFPELKASKKSRDGTVYV